MRIGFWCKETNLTLKHAVSDATFYNWKVKYGGKTVPEAIHLKALEDANLWLKEIKTYQILETAALWKLLSGIGGILPQNTKLPCIFGINKPVGVPDLSDPDWYKHVLLLSFYSSPDLPVQIKKASKLVVLDLKAFYLILNMKNWVKVHLKNETISQL